MALNTSPIKAVTKIPDFQTQKRKIKQHFEQVMQEARQEVSSMAKDQLQSSIIFKDSVASGTLLKSVYTRLLPAKSQDSFGINVGITRPASAYAYFANYGRAAGKNPPFSAIQKWASTKGITNDSIIWQIVHHIGEYGTEGHHFMEHAEPIIQRKARAILARKMQEFTRTL